MKPPFVKCFLINLSGITYESISSCNSLLDFLVGRLKKQSPHIKYKVRVKMAENSCSIMAFAFQKQVNS